MKKITEIATPPPKDLDLEEALLQENLLLKNSAVPILTVSATFRKELADKYHSEIHSSSPDVVFSRAHYSMAEAVRYMAEEMKLKAQMSDPTNYVSVKNWKNVEFVETSGQMVARIKLLKWLKDKVDTFVRGKLPVAEAIQEPLDYLTSEIVKPVVSLHYEVGNILAKNGKKVVQVVTDPHVRPQYLDCLPSDNITYALFDEETKMDFVAESKRQNKTLGENQLIVTGPPVDPRICRVGMNKKVMKKEEPVNLAICTGGLGTNLSEIRKALDILSPLLKPPEKIRLFLYAGTHKDFRYFFEEFAEKQNIRVGNLDDETARIRILCEDSIIDANNNLIKYMFPWAHGVMTKPSGDMAYDAAAAGCFMFFLQPWGEWEENIQKRFAKMEIGFDIDLDNDVKFLLSDWSSNPKLIQALENAHNLPKLFREGTKNIVNLQQKILKEEY